MRVLRAYSNECCTGFCRSIPCAKTNAPAGGAFEVVLAMEESGSQAVFRVRDLSLALRLDEIVGLGTHEIHEGTRHG